MSKQHFVTIEDAGTFLKEQLEIDLNTLLMSHTHVVLILPGGNSIKLFFSYLLSIKVPWERITIGLSDERCVPVYHEMSNEKQLKENFLNFLPAHNFCKLNEELTHKIKLYPTIIVLSMGDDGHVASLFPDDKDVLGSSDSIIEAQRADFKRVSLSLPVLLKAKKSYIIVHGHKKCNFLDSINSQEFLLHKLFKVSCVVKVMT